MKSFLGALQTGNEGANIGIEMIKSFSFYLTP